MSKVNESRSILENADMNTQKVVAARKNICEGIGLVYRSVNSYISSCNSINTFDFSTLYPTIPQSMLKDSLREFVQLLFIK